MANIPTFYQAAARSGEVTGADWVGGCNKGGSNAPGVGVATGVPNPPGWAEVEIDPVPSQAVGQAAGNVTLIQGADINDNVSLVQATGTVAPDGVIQTGIVNKTGVTLTNGDWAFGVKAVA